MRDKWDRKQSGSTYGAVTIHKAIESCSIVFVNYLSGYHSIIDNLHPQEETVQASAQEIPEQPEPPWPQSSVTPKLYEPPSEIFAPLVPLDQETLQLPSFPVDCLPKAISDYVYAVSVHSQTSVDMSAVIALGVLASCLQGKYRILGKEGYSEPLNL